MNIIFFRFVFLQLQNPNYKRLIISSNIFLAKSSFVCCARNSFEGTYSNLLPQKLIKDPVFLYIYITCINQSDFSVFWKYVFCHNLIPFFHIKTKRNCYYFISKSLISFSFQGIDTVAIRSAFFVIKYSIFLSIKENDISRRFVKDILQRNAVLLFLVERLLSQIFLDCSRIIICSL